MEKVNKKLEITPASSSGSIIGAIYDLLDEANSLYDVYSNGGMKQMAQEDNFLYAHVPVNPPLTELKRVLELKQIREWKVDNSLDMGVLELRKVEE